MLHLSDKTLECFLLGLFTSGGGMDEMDELTREFLIESQEGLDRMELGLTDLEQRPNDTALLADIFRSVHTIKGTTGFLGFRRLETLAHAGENLLGLLRDGKLAANGPIVTGLLQLLDGLRSILRTIEADDHEGNGSDTDLILKLEKLHDPATHVKAAATPRLKRSARARSGTAALADKPALAESCAQVPMTPAALPARVRNTPASSLVLAPAADLSPNLVKEAVVSRPRMAFNSAAESTLRVDVALLNRMMNLVGELVLTRNQVLKATAADPNLTMLSRRLDMVTADLREAVMKARMQPVSNVFSKVPRMVRDLSEMLNRRVRLLMEGQETELDKSLLEAIKDPLTHAVRNALDHGIEPPEVRVATGKDPEGTLKLTAMQQGSYVIIEVCDDGAGIAVDKVRDKAIERGLLTAERAAQQSERELLQILFVPGFSTAAAITNVSGRGVGMDVVRTNVEKIGGKVEIESNAGHGTTLRMRIPLTLAIVPALIVRSVGQSFALPQGALSELVHVSQDQAASTIEWIEDAPLYRLRGKLLPLVFLDRMLMPTATSPTRNGDTFIAILDAEGRRFGLVVDGLADPEEIVVKPLSATIKRIGLYSGATVLGSGDLALILDPGAIALKAGIAMEVEQEREVATSTDPMAFAGKDTKYLVVEVAGRQAAVPLNEVLRIEQLPVSRIEYSRSRPVLNFDGEIVPVEDVGGVLLSARDKPSRQIIVVVCRAGDRHVGIVVSHVLDVAAGGDLHEAGSAQLSEGVTVLKNRVTDIIDLGMVVAFQGCQCAANEPTQLVEKIQ